MTKRTTSAHLLDFRNRPAFALSVLATTSAVSAFTGAVQAQSFSIPVPNGSFETPVVVPPAPVSLEVTPWLRTGEPAQPGFPPGYSSAEFPNPAVGQPDHIDNLDGNQAAYMYPIPGLTLSQVLSDTFQPGVSYTLTVGVTGSDMSAGHVFTIGLYYLDGSSSPVTIASTQISYSTTAPYPVTHLVDYQAVLPTVQPGDAWAGESIGVKLEVTTSVGGSANTYWDIDNVRLTAVPEPEPIAIAVLGLGGLWLARRVSRRCS